MAHDTVTVTVDGVRITITTFVTRGGRRVSQIDAGTTDHVHEILVEVTAPDPMDISGISSRIVTEDGQLLVEYKAVPGAPPCGCQDSQNWYDSSQPASVKKGKSYTFKHPLAANRDIGVVQIIVRGVHVRRSDDLDSTSVGRALMLRMPVA